MTKPRETGKLEKSEPRESVAAAVIENPHAVAAAPSESMAGVVTVEDGVASQAPDFVVAGLTPGELVEALERVDVVPDGVLLENPNPPAPAPSELQSDAGALEGASVAPSSSAPVAAQAPTLAQPVRQLPRRPRLRVTFHYTHEDALSCELTLMDERRELLHRMTLQPTPRGPIARIFEALLAVVGNAAVAAGVFGAVPRPRESEPPPREYVPPRDVPPSHDHDDG